MASSLHGSARTTPRVRAEIQASQGKTGTLAKRYGLSRTTVAKWRARTTTGDAPMGPSRPRSTVLSPVEESMRMNRTVKDAAIEAFHYPDLESLKAHVLAFVSAYNFAKPLKALRWKTPVEAVCQAWTNTPDIGPAEGSLSTT